MAQERPARSGGRVSYRRRSAGAHGRTSPAGTGKQLSPGDAKVSGRGLAHGGSPHGRLLVRGVPLIGVCKGFSGGRVAGDFQVGLVFGPGFGQQPDPVPEPGLVHQTAQPIDAAPEYADLPFRLLPTVAMLGSKRLGRRPQVAWGDPAVMGVFRPGAVGQGQERRHRKRQPVAGDAGGVGPSGLVPLPAHALDGPPVVAGGRL